MVTNTNVLSGYWKDEHTGKRYILVKEDTAVMVSNVVAVLLTLSLPRMIIFIKLSVFYISKTIQNYAHGDGRMVSMHVQEHVPPNMRGEPQAVPLQDFTTPRPNIQNPLADEMKRVNEIVAEASTAEGLARLIIEEYVLVEGRLQLPTTPTTPFSLVHEKALNLIRSIREHPWKTTAVFTVSFLAFSIFIAYQVIAICANRIVGPSIARSAERHAGSWYPDILDAAHMVNTSIFPAVNDLHSELAFKSVSYAENCYKDDARPEECSIFYTSRINYQEMHNATCPFRSDLCLGPNSAYKLVTGFINARVLGINEKHTCRFRLQKTCAPIFGGEGYIRSKVIDEAGSRLVEYMYGDGLGYIQQGNKTFGELIRGAQEQMSDDLPRYIIREIKGDTLQLPGWKYPRQWIPGIRVPDSRVTLYFIRPVKLVYTKPSYDPIFLATVPSESMANGDPLYSSPYQRSTVLGCADSIEIQHPVSEDIWHPRYQNLSQLELPEWQSPNVISSLRMINTSYLQSEYFESRYVGMFEHFDAPRRIRNFYSSPLDPEQWKLEVRRMFNARLALLQYHVLGIAQGLGHDLPRARNLLQESGVDVAGKILFQSTDWMNIKVAELFGFLGLCAILWITTIRVGNTLVLWWVLKEKLYAPIKEKLLWIAAQEVNFDVLCGVDQHDEHED